jgi:type I restriction enzyme S subunit
MTEASLKPGWTKVKFGEVVRLCKDRSSDPETDGIERYVGLEHLEPEDLRIRRWGLVAEGTTFTSRFKPGQVLFGKRRAYQRKIAVADFEGVCSGDIYVLESSDSKYLLPELLPFICQTDQFFEYAVGTSAGSLSPRTNWKSLKNFEFLLPPLEQQRQSLRALNAIEKGLNSYRHLYGINMILLASIGEQMISDLQVYDSIEIEEFIQNEHPICYGVVQPGKPDPKGNYLIRVCDIENDSLDLSRLTTISESVDKQYKRSRVKSGDVLVSIVGTIGRIFVVRDEHEGFNIARAIARISPDPSICISYFLANYLNTLSIQRELTSEAFETARKTLNLNALKKIDIHLPPKEIQEEWVKRFFSLEQAKTLCMRRLEATQVTRKNILVELLGG